ncbi:MAG: F0F1 ATP synthase subunit delta [Candidatus Adiutricales bacterium]
MTSQIIARRYAKALLAIGRDDGDYAEYGRELATFAEIMGMADLTPTLSNPIYPKANRRAILDSILDKVEPSIIVRNFLGLLMEKDRISLIDSINDYYLRLVDEINNIERATVISAKPLLETIQDRVKASLEAMTGKTILLEVEQDEEIIGGVIARVGDLTLDGSVKTQLQNLKESLIKG